MGGGDRQALQSPGTVVTPGGHSQALQRWELQARAPSPKEAHVLLPLEGWDGEPGGLADLTACPVPSMTSAMVVSQVVEGSTRFR